MIVNDLETQLHDIARTERVDRRDNFRLMSANLRPARRGQHQNSQPLSGNVLLVAEVLVSSNEGFEIRLSRLQEGAVVKRRPAHLIGRRDGVAGQCATQRRGSSMVEENFPTGLAVNPARSRHRQTSLRVLQHKLDLFACHAGKPLQEIIDSRAILEVLEQCPDRHACAFEHPFAADFSRHAFNGRTLIPIEHNVILRDAGFACKAEHQRVPMPPRYPTFCP
jgi:hypothetical protein